MHKTKGNQCQFLWRFFGGGQTFFMYLVMRVTKRGGVEANVKFILGHTFSDGSVYDGDIWSTNVE